MISGESGFDGDLEGCELASENDEHMDSVDHSEMGILKNLVEVLKIVRVFCSI